MATAYLRPSADVSLNHSCSSGETGYNLINETTCDEDSTYISLSAYNDDETETSSFTCTGTITSGHRITAAKAIVYYKITDSDLDSSTIQVAVGSTTLKQTAMSTSYAALTYNLNTSDITLSGTSASATITITSYIDNGDKSTYYQRISQVYIELTTDEATQYTITSSTLGTGTVTVESPVWKNSNSTNKIYPGSGISITSLTDNGTDVTSSITYVTPTPTYSVTPQVSGASYGFTQGSTYWVSTNNGKSQSASICQLNTVCEVAATLVLAVINYAEATYDYGIIGAVDQTLDTSYTKDSGTSWDGSDESKNKSTEQDATITVPAGSHFIQLKYRKDQATSENNDNFQWRIKSFTYNSTVTGYYQYVINTVQANHSLICTFSDYTPDSFCWLKLDGTWKNCKSIWIKSNGVWTKQTTPPTGYTFVERKHNPWTFDKSLPKGAGLTDETDWLTTEYIAITPNTAITVTGGQCTVGVGFNCYNQDYSYYDWWSLASSTVIVTDKIYQRTLEAAKVADCYWVKINVPKAYYTYCKLEQNGVVLFDGSQYPYN